MSVWDAVVGQEATLDPLREAARTQAAMTHAWLIVGPPGSGRSLAARAFAAALQCTQGGCGACKSCVTATSGAHPDVTALATEKVTITVAEVRQLIDEAHSAPTSGPWRVIIVEDADRMTERTSNVLLKALEEPPPRTVWVLCAPSAQDLAITVRSRCRTVALQMPRADVVADILVREDGVEPALALTCARAAYSHIGVARRLARNPEARERRDRLISAVAELRGLGDAVLAAAEMVEVAESQAKAFSEERNAEERAQLHASLGVGDGERVPPALRSQVRQLEEDQKRRATRRKRDVLDRALLDVLSYVRDAVAVRVGSDVELVNEPHRASVERTAAETPLAALVERMDAVGVARERLAGNGAPLLVLEAMAVAFRPQPVG